MSQSAAQLRVSVVEGRSLGQGKFYAVLTPSSTRLAVRTACTSNDGIVRRVLPLRSLPRDLENILL
jgi:hypothetical protein